MYRIKQSDLEYQVSVINTKKGFELPVSYSEIGAYVLSYAYGGVSLHQYVNTNGAINDVFRCGHVPKRDLYNRMNAFIDGLD